MLNTDFRIELSESEDDIITSLIQHYLIESTLGEDMTDETVFIGEIFQIVPGYQEMI